MTQRESNNVLVQVPVLCNSKLQDSLHLWGTVVYEFIKSTGEDKLGSQLFNRGPNCFFDTYFFSLAKANFSLIFH